MKNRDQITCSDNDCVGKVVWQSSGYDAYDEHIPDHKLVIDDNKCTRMKDATVIESDNCNDENANKFVCEFTCSQPTTATPSTVANKEASTGMLQKSQVKSWQFQSLLSLFIFRLLLPGRRWPIL